MRVCRRKCRANGARVSPFPLTTRTPRHNVSRMNATGPAVVLLAIAACGSPRERAADTNAVAQTANVTTPAHTLALHGDFKGPLGVQLYTFRDAMPKDVPGTLRR